MKRKTKVAMPSPDTVKVDKPCVARFWNGKEWQLCDKQPVQVNSEQEGK